ncbi:hypothetical protein [Pseudomonas sp. G2-4]|uniref:hypothetical protein n=1 Tax=Pseudomonas sp. G2-4 TaxID=1506334 RepID=UPI0024B9A44F|nr:hypothetical protein [Pseudomonas sp. G2-4]WHS57713.1 hypothetical protein QNH97_14595 [Pseudomonas sp. G2-4]
MDTGNPLNPMLVLAAGLSAVASLLHLMIILGGGPWYRFFGAVERFARAADAGRVYPSLVTAGIAAVLGLWAAYALAAGGLRLALPWVPQVMCALTAVYLVRGLAIVPLILFTRAAVTPFLLWSSGVCMLVGLYQAWPRKMGASV